MHTLLLIEDDQEIRELLEYHLKEEGYEVISVADGITGRDEAISGRYSLILLDLMLPGLNGLDICREVHSAYPETLIVILSARSDEIDRILGLELGADDYVTKPFSLREVLTRIKALLRRATRDSFEKSDEKELLVFAELSIDTARKKVFKRGIPIELTAKEYELLLFFARNPGRPFSREALLSYVWNYDFEGYARTVTSHINRLRNKIEDNPTEPRFILTERGFGYRFMESTDL